MLHQVALLTARNHALEEQLEAVTKRRARKRKRLQKGGVLEYGTAAEQVATVASLPRKVSKKTRGSSALETVPATQRRCGNCGETGHNARTCQNDRVESSESSESEISRGSIVGSDENK